MATEAPPSAVPEELEAIFLQLGEPLLEELEQLSAMPQVMLTAKSVFDRATPLGSRAQLRGVQFNLRCCPGQPLMRKCNDLTDERACPTVLEAAQFLRAKVTKEHGSEACLARASEKLEAAGSSIARSTEQPRDAFAVMIGARLAIQRARSALKQAEQSAEQRRAQARDAQRQLEQVSCTRLEIAAPALFGVESWHTPRHTRHTARAARENPNPSSARTRKRESNHDPAAAWHARTQT